MSRHVAIIGAGHAGCEATFAAVRLGARVSLFTLSLDAIALMPCNPCIGGTAKGHLVREIDALGGMMGIAADKTFIQSRMLNTAKGPAVHSLRAQIDKANYQAFMRQKLEDDPNVHIYEGEIVDIQVENDRVRGILHESGQLHTCDAVIVACGTYLNARCLYGSTITKTGPNGLRASTRLTDTLKRLGFIMQRFKTGTPARVHSRSIDFTKMAVQPGDTNIVPFSFLANPAEMQRKQIPCHLTYTNEETHAIIGENITRSAMYSGEISATGTRYCPSIEDKIVRFQDKTRHQVFVEPEGEHTRQMYIQGMSSALPLDVQIRAYRTIPGLECCEIMRAAYAIEYDCLDPTALTPNLEAKHVPGLFFAGQICGSSGYEEAAAQGLVAGAAAADSPIQINRSEGYIGVLIDDLVTKGTNEPYRMMTSRAEYRLWLRQDNADLRLTKKAYDCGLVSQGRYDEFAKKAEAIDKLTAAIRKQNISANTVNPILAKLGSATITGSMKLTDLFKRPEVKFEHAWGFFGTPDATIPAHIHKQICEQVYVQTKYAGYIAIMRQEIEDFRRNEVRVLPASIDYAQIRGLRIEAQQKLNKIMPKNLGQAARITGVSPADVAVLMIYLRAHEMRT